MLRKLILSVAVAAAIAAPMLFVAPAQVQAQEGIHRLVWQYDGGFFKDQGNAEWVEQNYSGSYHFVEARRNREFIELYDASRNISVRLYSDVSYIQVNGSNYGKLYDGRWTR